MAAKRVFTIEGEIGAGKTELAKSLAAELRARGKSVCLVLEPVNQWKETGVLQEFYANPTQFAYSFQTFVFATRILEIHKGMQAQPDADIYLFERSPISDRIFMALQDVKPIEREMYEAWCDSWLALHPVDFSSATAIYLRTNIDTCMSRVSTRARDGEIKSEAQGNGVTVEYQKRLKLAHEAYFMGLHPGMFRHLPRGQMGRTVAIGSDIADRDFREGAKNAKNILSSIIHEMGVD